MKKNTLRFLVVLFWSSLLLLALYGPKIQSRDFEENSITVFTWGDILEPSILADFEKETGIKVHLNYYSSNEELLVKLKATHGEGFDLIVPSDYAVRLLIREKLLQPLDRQKLDFWTNLNPLLLGHFYDAQNQFSVPFSWEIFGLGLDKEYFADKAFAPSWKLIFDINKIHYRIGMVNDPIEAVEFAAFYLFGPGIIKATPEQERSIAQLLFRQHPLVEAYADFRANYLLATKNCPAVLSSSSYIFRTMRLFPFVAFAVPEEGTFITIENLCIPSASKKEALVYRLMNYLYRRESLAAHFDAFGIFPAAKYHKGWNIENLQAQKLLDPTPEEFSRYHFFRTDILPEETVRNLWVEVKTQ